MRSRPLSHGRLKPPPRSNPPPGYFIRRAFNLLEIGSNVPTVELVNLQTRTRTGATGGSSVSVDLAPHPPN
jgi:hypothetical protein